MGVGEFLKIVKKYSNLEELNPGVLGQFIGKIAVHHRKNIVVGTVQKVGIPYKMMRYAKTPNIREGKLEILRRSSEKRAKII